MTIIHTGQITTLQATDASLSAATATNTGAITALNLNKLDKTSLDGISVIYRDGSGNVQLKYDGDVFKEVSLVSGNARLFTLQDTYKNLPTTLSDSATNLSTSIGSSSNNNIDYTKLTSNNLWSFIYK